MLDDERRRCFDRRFCIPEAADGIPPRGRLHVVLIQFGKHAGGKHICGHSWNQQTADDPSGLLRRNARFYGRGLPLWKGKVEEQGASTCLWPNVVVLLQSSLDVRRENKFLRQERDLLEGQLDCKLSRFLNLLLKSLLIHCMCCKIGSLARHFTTNKKLGKELTLLNQENRIFQEVVAAGVKQDSTKRLSDVDVAQL